MEIRGWQILRCPWIRISDHPSIVQDRDSKETQLYKPIVYVVTLFDQMGCNPLKVCSRCRDNHFKTGLENSGSILRIADGTAGLLTVNPLEAVK